MSVANEAPVDRPRAVDDADIDIGVPDVFGVLAKRKWTVAVVALLVAAASFASASTQKITYTSEGSVLVATTAQTAAGAAPLATENQLAESRQVASLVAQNLKLTDTPEQLLTGLSVSVPLGTQILEFKYTAATPDLAEKVAQGFVDAYLGYRAQLLKGMLESSRAVSDQVDVLRRSLVVAQAAAARPRSSGAAAASAQVDALTGQITALDQKLTTLLSSDNLVTSTTAQPAAPAVENRPAPVKQTIVGLMAGLVVGAFVAFAFEFLGRRRRERRKRERDTRVSAVRNEPHVLPADRITPDFGEMPQVTGWGSAARTPPSSS